MALLVMPFRLTKESGRTSILQRTIPSLVKTVDWERHRIVIVSDSSEVDHHLFSWMIPSKSRLEKELNCHVGIAKAVNNGIALRVPGEVVIKVDDDIFFHDEGWVDQIEDVFTRDPTIGICGLKRPECIENPSNPDPNFRSSLHLLPQNKHQRWLVVSEAPHILGSVEGFSPLLLDKIGGLYQMGNWYGFEDAFSSIRCHDAGFRTVYLPGPFIIHIQEEESGYTSWKKSQVDGSWNEYERRVREKDYPLFYNEV